MQQHTELRKSLNSGFQPYEQQQKKRTMGDSTNTVGNSCNSRELQSIESFQTPPKNRITVASSDANTHRKSLNKSVNQSQTQGNENSQNQSLTRKETAIPGISRKSVSRQMTKAPESLFGSLQAKQSPPRPQQQQPQCIQTQNMTSSVQVGSNSTKRRPSINSSSQVSQQNQSLNNSFNMGASQNIQNRPNSRGRHQAPLNDYQLALQLSQSLDEQVRNEKKKLNNIVNQVSSQSNQHLQESIQEKEMVIQLLQQQNNSFKEQLELQKSSAAKEIQKHKTFQEIILSENKALSRQIIVLTEMYYEQHRSIQKQYNEKNYEAQGLKNPLYDEKVLDYRVKYEQQTDRVRQLEQQLSKLNEDFLANIENRDFRIQELQTQNSQIKNDLKNTVKRIKELELQNDKLQFQVEEERNKIAQIESEQKIEQIKANQNDILRKALSRQQNEIEELKREKHALEVIIEQSRQDTSKTASMYFEKDTEIDFLQKEISNLMKEKSDKEFIIKSNIHLQFYLDLTQENLRLANQCSELENDGKMAAILHQEIEYLQNQLTNNEKHCHQLEGHIQLLQQGYEDSQLNLEQTINSQQDLLSQVKEREQELERMGEYLSDLQRINFVYVPVKDDHVDKKLAEFINNNTTHKKASMLFVREQEGVYQYGKRKIFIKVEKDSLIIRVGGGFLVMDEFIDKYSPYEVRKSQKAQYQNMLLAASNAAKGQSRQTSSQHHSQNSSTSKQPKIISHSSYNTKELATINGELPDGRHSLFERNLHRQHSLEQMVNDIVEESTEGEETITFNINMMTHDQIDLA